MTTPMNRVWKVASRWSETGTADSSILDIFRRHNVVFVGKFQDRFQQIAVGDLIVISDAKRVVAMGLATTPPRPVTELGLLEGLAPIRGKAAARTEQDPGLSGRLLKAKAVV